MLVYSSLLVFIHYSSVYITALWFFAVFFFFFVSNFSLLTFFLLTYPVRFIGTRRAARINEFQNVLINYRKTITNVSDFFFSLYSLNVKMFLNDDFRRSVEYVIRRVESFVISNSVKRWSETVLKLIFTRFSLKHEILLKLSLYTINWKKKKTKKIL